MGVEVMIWSPYYPDLNPIENLWALMKSIIYSYTGAVRRPGEEEAHQLV